MKKFKKWSERTPEEKAKVKAIIKKVIVVGLVVVTILASAMATLVACNKTNPTTPGTPIIHGDTDPGGGTNPIVNPDNPGGSGDENPIVNPDDPTVNPDDPTVNPDDPSVNPDDPGTNPDDPIVNPDDPTVNPDDPDNPGGGEVNPDNPDNPGGGEVNPDNPDNPGGEVNPDDPDNPGGGEVNPDNPDNPGGEVNPDNPENPDTPIVTNLDFSGLENKLEEVITSQSKYNTINQILSYSIKDGKLYVAYDYNTKYDSIIAVYSFETTEDLSSQESIDNLVAEIDISNFEGIEFGKATEDIVVDDVTYSKDGITGDNVFAQQCGVQNALVTYVSNIGTPGLTADSSTHYSAGYDVLVVFNDEGNLMIRNQHILVECEQSSTQQQILQNALGGNSYVGGSLTLSEPINLGKNLMPDEATSSAEEYYMSYLTNKMVNEGEWYL